MNSRDKISPRALSASIGPQASASKGSNISDAPIRASSAARYFSLLMLTVLVTFHSGIALNAFSSAMQEWKQACPTSYGGSFYLIFVLVEVVNISIHACGLFLVWRGKLNAHQHADCMLLITCCWPVINLTGALTVSVFALQVYQEALTLCSRLRFLASLITRTWQHSFA